MESNRCSELEDAYLKGDGASLPLALDRAGRPGLLLGLSLSLHPQYELEINTSHGNSGRSLSFCPFGGHISPSISFVLKSVYICN